MSLVMTPILKSSARLRHKEAITVLLPVPTGPATPRRSERVLPVLWVWLSGNEQPPCSSRMFFRPVLEPRRAERRETGTVAHGTGVSYYLSGHFRRVEQPAGDFSWVDRQ